MSEDNRINFKEKRFNAKDVKPFLGKFVKYLEEKDIDRSGRGLVFFRYGYVEEVVGRNVRIDGDYKWIPNLRHMTLHEEEDE